LDSPNGRTSHPGGARRSPEEIEDWNQRFLTKRPETEEHQKYFHTVRDGIDPTRTDITTWVDLLDMEEG
jgi:hypothetical protein